jgi:hypothetical protein
VTEMLDTADQGMKMPHGKDNSMTDSMVTQKIPANCEDTKQAIRFILVGLLGVQSLFHQQG